MPLFEYHCYTHGIFETLLPSHEDWFVCPVCGIICEWVPSRVTMRPDTSWMGVVDPHLGYVTSDSQIKAMMKEKGQEWLGDRADVEGMAKIADQARKDKDAEMGKKWGQWAEKAFGPSGLALGGAEGEKIIRDEIASQKKGMGQNDPQ